MMAIPGSYPTFGIEFSHPSNIKIIIQHFDLRQIDRMGGTISINISPVLIATHGSHPVWMELGNLGNA